MKDKNDKDNNLPIVVCGVFCDAKPEEDTQLYESRNTGIQNICTLNHK